MSQAFRKNNFAPGSLRGPRTARTLLLRMAADQERADRIRETWQARKAEDPKRYTWRRIAAAVNGVSERAAQDWQKTGGIDYDNARLLAEYLSVDFDWLWRGPKEEAETPDPFAREAQVDDGFVEFREHVAGIRGDIADVKTMLEQARTEREEVWKLLAEQKTILRELRRLAKGLPSDGRLAEVRSAVEALEARGRRGGEGRRVSGGSKRPRSVKGQESNPERAFSISRLIHAARGTSPRACSIRS